MSSARGISRHVPAVFAAVMVLFIGALAWAGWTLIAQDRDLVEQRKRDLVEASVSEAAAFLTAQIAQDQDRLSDFLRAAPPDFDALDASGRVVLLIDEGLIQAYPDSALRYYPGEPPTGIVDSRLDEADRLEFGQKALGRASSILEELSATAGPATRAGALVRLARIRKKQGRNEEALDLYLQLTGISEASVSGRPAALVGLYGRCEILDGQQSHQLLGQEVVQLATTLRAGGNQISKSVYLYYAQSAFEWANLSGALDGAPWIESLSNPHITSEAATLLHGIRDGWIAGSESSEGIRSALIDSAVVVLQWLGSGGRFVGTIQDVRPAHNPWFTLTGPQPAGIGLSITDDAGSLLFSTGESSENILASRSLSSAGQAWTISSFITDSFQATTQNQVRRRILIASLLLVLVIVATSTYFLSRALRKEVATAKLQSDFVSAVSHEFRTPLTSMRQITELLLSGRVPSEERQREYFADLDTDSRRLSRLVEGLLSFGRMEAGEFPYALEPLDLADLVGDTVSEFRDEGSLPEDVLRLKTEANPTCDIDRVTFTLALWNLLDNALKYGGDQPDIQVTVAARGAEAVVSVSDKGSGISKADQDRIFDKFVRGSDTGLASVRGTGLGLALVETILSNHSGKVVLVSEPGAGSTFSLVLPIHEAA